jgi:hypothetical protein
MIRFTGYLPQFSRPQAMSLPELKKRGDRPIEAAETPGKRIPVNHIGHPANGGEDQDSMQ